MKLGRKKQLIKDGQKQCSRCKKWLFLKEFSKSKHLSSDYRSHCKRCQSKEGLSPIGIYWRTKSRSNLKRLNIISQEGFRKWYEGTEKVCKYCGISEEEIKNDVQKLFGYGKNKRRLEIDRMDNSKGYIKGNLTLSCSLCNYIKGSYFTVKEMLILGNDVKAIREQRKKPAT